MKKILVVLMFAVFAALTCVSVASCTELAGTDSTSTDTCKHENIKETVVEATCLNDGQRKSVCLDCGYEFPVEKIDALGHDLEVVEVNEATCASPKITTKRCTRCGEYFEEEEGEPLTHNYVEASHTDATCTDAATITYECTLCHAKKTETPENSAPLGHNYVHVEANDTPATCTTAGEQYYECDRCHDYYTDVLPALGHTPADEGVVYEATCTEKGYTLMHCTICDEDYSINFVNALGHDLEADGSVAATCDHMGYDKLGCTRCDYEEHVNVSLNTEHTFNASGVCTACGKKASKAYALTCADDELYAVLQNNNEYSVYAPSYTYWTNLKISKSVLEGLYANGIYAIDFYFGSNTDKVSKTIAYKVQGIDGALNCTSREFKFAMEYEFADENGLKDAVQDGIEIAAYYREMNQTDEVVGKPRLSAYGIRLAYVYKFDINNSDSFVKTSMEYNYDSDTKTFTFNGGLNTNGSNEFTIDKGLFAYYYEMGYKTVGFQLSHASTQHFTKNMTIYYNDQTATSGNTNATAVISPINITDLVDYDMRVSIYCVDNYGTAWNPAEPVDRFIFKLKLEKDVSANTSPNGQIANYGEELEVTAATPVTDGNVTTIVYSLTLKDHTYGFINFNSMFINSMVNQGYNNVVFRIGPNTGYKSCDLSGTDMTTITKQVGNGGVSFDAIEIKANADYHIRFYLAATTDLTITAEFIKNDKAYNVNTNAGIEYTSEVGKTSSEGDTITYTLPNLEKGVSYRVYIYPSIVNAMIAKGYENVTVIVGGTWGYKDCYLNGTRSVANGNITFATLGLVAGATHWVQVNESISDDPQTMTVKFVFVKSSKAYNVNTNEEISFTKEAGTTNVENDTLIYTISGLEKAVSYRLYIYTQVIDAMAAAGYDKVSVVITGIWGYKDCYFDGTRQVTNASATYEAVDLAGDSHWVQITHSISDEPQSFTVKFIFSKSAE